MITIKKIPVFNKLFKREKPRVYLGALAVAPRTDIKRHFDQQGLFEMEDLDHGLQQVLKEIFSLPSVQEVQEPRDSDLGLDVVIAKFQSGDWWDLSLGDFGIPLLWRPKITVSSRLFDLKSGRTKETFSVTNKMPWGQFVRRLLTWRAIARFRPAFDRTDMERLLYQGCHKLLLKIQKAM